MPFIAHRVFDWVPVEIDDSWKLKTINNGIAYSICNSLQCSNCHHLFLDIRFNDIEMDCLYKGYREDAYVNLREKYEPGYLRKNKDLNKGYNYIKDIERFIKPYLSTSLKILDWGGDTGKNTPFRSSYDLMHIYDISNVEVLGNATMVGKEEISNTSYDLIICSNVLEHIPYPKTVLNDIKIAMNQKTILYIELPYENLVRDAKKKSDLYKIKKHWHEHINFFNLNSIEQLLISSNYKIIEINTLRISGETSDYIFQVCCKLN